MSEYKYTLKQNTQYYTSFILHRGFISLSAIITEFKNFEKSFRENTKYQPCLFSYTNFTEDYDKVYQSRMADGETDMPIGIIFRKAIWAEEDEESYDLRISSPSMRPFYREVIILYRYDKKILEKIFDCKLTILDAPIMKKEDEQRKKRIAKKWIKYILPEDDKIKKVSFNIEDEENLRCEFNIFDKNNNDYYEISVRVNGKNLVKVLWSDCKKNLNFE